MMVKLTILIYNKKKKEKIAYFSFFNRLTFSLRRIIM